VVIPKFSFTASSTIRNPYYVMYYDTDFIFRRFQSEKIQIIEKCNLSLLKYGMSLIFDNNAVTFCIDPDSEVDEHGNPFVEPLLTYLKFATYLNYNMVAGPKIGKASISDLPCADEIIVNIGQITQSETNADLTTKIVPTKLEISKFKLEDFLSVIRWELYLAISYYLLGCQNIEYFLIEFYKSAEVIKNYFGNDKNFKKCIGPFGFNWKEYKRFKQVANDERNPLNIGRHAPKKDTEMSIIDVKNLISEPKSKQLFENSTNLCRDLIDIFIDYLKTESSQKREIGT